MDSVCAASGCQQVVATWNCGASSDDIVNVWRYASSYIERQMMKGRGVTVGGLGTFSFSDGNQETTGKGAKPSRPIFTLAEKFVQQHQLDHSRRHVEGKVPVGDLNYAAIACDSPFSRDFVEQIVRLVINELSRALAGGRNVDFRFEGIGRLMIKQRKVKMKFLKDFLTNLDPSGQLTADLKDRPYTADSVISRATTARPQTVNTLAFPSLKDGSSKAKSAMAAINEESDRSPEAQDAQDFGGQQAATADLGFEPNQPAATDPKGAAEAKSRDNRPSVECSDSHGDSCNRDGGAAGGGEENRGETEADGVESVRSGMREPPPLRSSSASAGRRPAPLSTAGIVSYDELLTTEVGAGVSGHKSSLPPRSPNVGGEGEMRLALKQKLRNDKEAPRASPESRHHSCPGHPAAAATAALNSDKLLERPPSLGCTFCRLCARRREANVRISLSAERSRRDESETRILHELQLLKEKEALLQEQDLVERKMAAAKEAADFNAAVAEVKLLKRRASSGSELPQSYIFHRRPLTPHRSVKQSQFAAVLDEQVEQRAVMVGASRAQEDLRDRLEQVALAEDLAKQRESYLRKMTHGQQRYKAALETQMHYKPLPIPACQPDNEVFGKNEPTADDVSTKRQQAKAIMSDQKEAEAERKRLNLLQRIHDQEEAVQLLSRNREEILQAMARSYEVALRRRQTLEKDWHLSSQAKRARELEERLREISEHGLVHEQCNKYQRCTQCKKRVGNAGETNLWRDDSRYVTGARMMA